MHPSTHHHDRSSLRRLVGREVDVVAGAEQLHGVLLSYTTSSLWLVAGDEDRIVALHSVHEVLAA
jgi:hypothetical protein